MDFSRNRISIDLDVLAALHPCHVPAILAFDVIQLGVEYSNVKHAVGSDRTPCCREFQSCEGYRNGLPYHNPSLQLINAILHV